MPEVHAPTHAMLAPAVGVGFVASVKMEQKRQEVEAPRQPAMDGVEVPSHLAYGGWGYLKWSGLMSSSIGSLMSSSDALRLRVSCEMEFDAWAMETMMTWFFFF
jgi:hypothetical protein